MRTVFRYDVPVDDRPHEFELRGPLLAVGCRKADVVEFWALRDTAVVEFVRTYQVFGTGQPDVDGVHRGTAYAADGQLVWHLFELGGAA
jgi:hypothetical protein